MDKNRFRLLKPDTNVFGKFALDTTNYLQNVNDESFEKEWNYIIKGVKVSFIR